MTTIMLEKRFKFIHWIREFFLENRFIEIDCPPLVENPGMEIHIHPFKVGDKYLHTSPEFAMKEVLSKTGLKNIFTIGYVFRDEPLSEIHRPQFLMLEWYRRDAKIEKIIQDTEELLKFLSKKLSKENIKLNILTIDEIFQDILDIKISDYLDIESITHLFKSKFPKLLPHDCSQLLWEDYFFLIFLNYIEPKLKSYENLILKSYPAPLSALSKIDSQNPKYCKRFELYIKGVEIANCFEECTSKKEIQERFEIQNKLKSKLYQYELPKAERFLSIMENYPESSGIALGVERLLKSFTQEQVFWD